ncbi:TPA: hypothetical protein ACL34Z_001917, partial [Streptococcus pneumoniae]
MINSSKYLKFVLYYQIISFYFLGIFYRLSTFNQYLYVIADIVFISVYLLIFERKIAYTNIKLFIIFILFYLFGSFQGYDSGGAFI